MLQIIILLFLPCLRAQLDCYQCQIVKQSEFLPNSTQNLCEKFDQSVEFIKRCKNASFCRKTVITANIAGAKVGIERDCVDRVYNVRVDYDKDGVWDTKHQIVADAFTEGCSAVDSRGMRDVKIQNCYCSSNLCNSGMRISGSFFVFTFWLFINFLSYFQ